MSRLGLVVFLVVVASSAEVLAQRPLDRDPSRADRLYNQQFNRDLQLRDQQRQYQDLQQQQWRQNESERQRQYLERQLRTRPETGRPSYVPGQARAASRGTGCVAMAFDSKGAGLRVTRRTGYGNGRCDIALAACREAVQERSRKYSRFRGAACRIVDP